MEFYGIKLGKFVVTRFYDVKIRLRFTISYRKKYQWTIAWKLCIVFSCQRRVKPVLELPSWKSASKVDPNRVSVENKA